MRNVTRTLALVVLTVAGSACSSAATTAGSVTTNASVGIATTSPIATSGTSAVAAPTTAPATTAAPATTSAATTSAATTVAPTTAAPTTTTNRPDAVQALPGVAPVAITVGGDDPARPAFAWAAPPGAVTYQVAVQTAAGVPLWGWTGTDAHVVLGGASLAPGNGPALVGTSRVRVYAFDAGRLLVGVSSWVSLPG